MSEVSAATDAYLKTALGKLQRIPLRKAWAHEAGEFTHWLAQADNRTLHQMFLLINLGERAGSGVPKIRRGWADAGHGLELYDSFEPFDHTVLEMMWGQNAPEKTPDAILMLLKRQPDVTISQLAETLKKSSSAVERALRKLREQGRLRRIGPDNGGTWEVLS